jgi:hypothetical protein
VSRTGALVRGTAALLVATAAIALVAYVPRGCDVEWRNTTGRSVEGFCGVFDPMSTLIATVRTAVGPKGRVGMDGGSMAEAMLAFQWRPDAARGAPQRLRHDAELVVRTVRSALLRGSAAPLEDPSFVAAVGRLRPQVDRLCERYRIGS